MEAFFDAPVLLEHESLEVVSLREVVVQALGAALSRRAWVTVLACLQRARKLGKAVETID